MDYCILAAGWLVFCVLHSLLAAERCKAFFMVRMGRYYRYYRLMYSMVAFITLGAVLWWQLSIPGYYFHLSTFISYFIALPGAIWGATMMAICIRKYFYRLSGIEALYQQPGRPVLETKGVHKFVRHPLYIATLVLIWSLFLLFPSLANLIACVMITAYVRIGIYSEELTLMQIFGSEYEEYKKNTAMLIPIRPVKGFFRRLFAIR